MNEAQEPSSHYSHNRLHTFPLPAEGRYDHRFDLQECLEFLSSASLSSACLSPPSPLVCEAMWPVCRLDTLVTTVTSYWHYERNEATKSRDLQECKRLIEAAKGCPRIRSDEVKNGIVGLQRTHAFERVSVVLCRHRANWRQ